MNGNVRKDTKASRQSVLLSWLFIAYASLLFLLLLRSILLLLQQRLLNALLQRVQLGVPGRPKRHHLMGRWYALILGDTK